MVDSIRIYRLRRGDLTDVTPAPEEAIGRVLRIVVGAIRRLPTRVNKLANCRQTALRELPSNR